MGGYFSIQSELILIESVMGKQDTLARLDYKRTIQEKDKAERNTKRFSFLSEEKKNATLSLYSVRQAAVKAPFSAKLGLALKQISQAPLLEILWILLSIIFPILLLLQKKHALTWVWILPLLTLAYAVNNQVRGKESSLSERILYPSELFSKGVTIESAWENYLISEWAKTDKTKEDGEFYFNLARLDYIPPLQSTPFWEKKSLLVLFLYVVWNIYFAKTILKN